MMTKTNENEKLSQEDFILTYLGAFGAYTDYFIQPAYYGVSLQSDGNKLELMANVLDDNIPVEIIILKLVHNICVINQHHRRVAIEGNFTEKACFNHYFEMCISPDQTKISDFKGYGFLGVKNNEATYSILKLLSSIQDYIKELSKRKKYAKFSMITSDFLNLRFKHPDDALYTVISENLDWYSKYKKQLEK